MVKVQDNSSNRRQLGVDKQDKKKEIFIKIDIWLDKVRFHFKTIKLNIKNFFTEINKIILKLKVIFGN